MKFLSITLALVFSLFFSGLQAQTTYLAVENRLVRVTLPDWNATVIGPFQPAVGLDDLSFHPNGKLYGFSAGTKKLYEINPLNAQMSEVATLPFGATGMVAGKDGKLYLALDHLFTFDPTTMLVTDLGKLNYDCAGDLIFWQGDLYMTSVSNGLIQVDLQNPALSTPWVPLPPSLYFFGLTTDWNCLTGEGFVYAIGGIVYKIDMNLRSFEPVPGVIVQAAGAAYTYEYEGFEPKHGVLDTILTISPTCGETNGTISLLLQDPAQDVMFSLDSLHWQQSGEFPNLPAGVYKIYVQNSCQTKPLVVILPDAGSPENPSVSVTSALCGLADGAIHLTGLTPGIEFKLDQSDWRSGPDYYDYLQAGQYVVTVRNAQGCQNFKYVNIPVNNAVSYLDLQGAGIICKDIPFSLTVPDSGQQITYHWQLNGAVVKDAVGNELQLTIAEPGIYTIQVQYIDQHGCYHAGETVDTVANCFQIPNAFSPDGNGINDDFGPVTFGNDISYNMTIYNRWGQIVFQNDPATLKWDGTTKEDPAVSDVYFYVINILKPTPEQYTGSVTLIR